MSFGASPVASTSRAGDGDTSAIDTTGADLLVVVVTNGLGTSGTVSDSKSNTWVPLTKQEVVSDSRVRIYYAKNATVGSGHTFNFSGGSADYPSFSVSAWSGSDLTAPFDQENGATGSSVSSQSTGGVTPSENGELLVAGICFGGPFSSLSVDGGFTVGETVAYGNGVNYGGARAYLVQTSAAAANPQFSWTGASNVAAAIATFKAAAGGGSSGSPWNLTLLGVGGG